MNIRPRTVRRLALIFAAAAILGAVGLGLYLRNGRARANRLAADRAAGIEAFASGDYVAAVTRLRSYVWRVPDDVEAQYAFGLSRLRVEEPDESNVAQAKAALLRVLQLDRNHENARRALLEVYGRSQYTAEAIKLADELLAKSPDDPAALGAKVQALRRMHRFAEALEMSRKLNALRPDDIAGQMLTCELMSQSGQTPEQIIEHVRKQQQARPDEPRFALLLAMAYRNAGKPDDAREWLLRSTTRPATDGTFIAEVTRQLDAMGLPDKAELFLESICAGGKQREAQRLLLRRLWQDGRMRDVLDHGGEVDTAGGDAGVLAYRAMALYALGRGDEAQAIIAELAKRKSDAQASAWSVALNARYTLASTTPRPAVVQLQGAIRRASDKAPMAFLLGEVYEQLGETDLAIGTWQRCSESAPAWPLPRIRASAALAETGRIEEAIREATAALLGAPRDITAAANLAALRFRQLSPGQVNKDLVELVQKVQTASPGEPISLPAHVALLNRAGQREKAVEALRAALVDSARYGQSSLLGLAEVSRREKLDLEDDLLSAAARKGETPRLVLARARLLADSGHAEEGLALLESRARANSDSAAQWQLAIAQYRELASEPGAAAAWVALGDANVRDLPAQMAILRSAASVRQDRAFMSRTIDRVRDLTGPDGLTWKLERARMLVDSPDRDRDAAEAVTLLNQVVRAAPSLVEAHVLLSIAYESVGNLPAATRERQAAADLDRGGAGSALETARLLQAQGRYAEARNWLDRVGAAKDLSPDLRQRLAGLYAQQGDFAAARRALLPAEDALQAAGELLLAEMQQRQNRPEEAEKVYVRLLARKPPDLAAIQSAAAFYASRRDMDKARATIARVSELKLPPGGEMLAKAAFEERFGSPEAATQCYEAATSAAPADLRTWRSLVLYQLRMRRLSDAQDSVNAALKRLPDDPTLTSLQRLIEGVIASAATPFDLTPLGEIFAGAPEHPAVKELLAGMQSARQQKLAPEVALGRLRTVAERYPRVAPVQLALVQWNVRLGRTGEAARVAGQLMDQFPGSADVARLAGQTYALAGKWELAAGAIQKWRERSLERPEEADIALAEARIRLNDASGAVRILEPYVNMGNLDRNPALLSACARALASAGQAERAAALLEPLLAQSLAARQVWVQTAADSLPNFAQVQQWLERAATTLAVDAENEQIELARAWYTASQRLAEPAGLARAEAILLPLVGRADASADRLALAAVVADRMGKWELAITRYRAALRVDARQGGCLNNLAYLLLQHGDTAEARSLAEQAVALAPASADYLDTLARIQRKQGDLAGSIATFVRALKLDAANLPAMIGMASACRAAGREAEAGKWLVQIEQSMGARRSPLPAAVADELSALRGTKASAQ